MRGWSSAEGTSIFCPLYGRDWGEKKGGKREEKNCNKSDCKVCYDRIDILPNLNTSRADLKIF